MQIKSWKNNQPFFCILIFGGKSSRENSFSRHMRLSRRAEKVIKIVSSPFRPKIKCSFIQYRRCAAVFYGRNTHGLQSIGILHAKPHQTNWWNALSAPHANIRYLLQCCVCMCVIRTHRTSRMMQRQIRDQRTFLWPWHLVIYYIYKQLCVCVLYICWHRIRWHPIAFSPYNR